MKVIEKAALFDQEAMCQLSCERINRVHIECGRRLLCPELDHVLDDILVACGPGFFEVCGQFVDKIGPICPFDPVFRAKDYFINKKFDYLEAKVKELDTHIIKG